ncbi:Methenyltetrahydrofolate cyclohydrolase [subsurface metagenome]
MKDFLEKLASDSPTPGGGSASAASGAIGAALLSMVYSISRKKIINSLNKLKKKKSIKSKDLLREQETQNILIEEFSKSADEAKRVMNKLLLLVDEDAKAYESVLRQIRKSKKVKTNDNKVKGDIQEAYKNAAEVPFQIAKLCHKVLRNSRNLTDKINNAVKSDFQIAISLLELAIRGAALNVEVNLKEIVDRKYVIEKKKELNRITQIL